MSNLSISARSSRRQQGKVGRMEKSFDNRTAAFRKIRHVDFLGKKNLPADSTREPELFKAWSLDQKLGRDELIDRREYAEQQLAIVPKQKNLERKLKHHHTQGQ